MKYLLFFFCLLFTSQLYGQRNKNARTNYFLHVQGGFLLDNSFDIPYKGFNLVNVGWSRSKKNTLQSVQLELIASNVKKERISNNTVVGVYEGKRRSIELIYNYSFGLTEKVTNGFYIGPSASLIVNSNAIIPLTSSAFPIEDICFCFGAGVNTGYNWKLNKSTMLGISTRITLVDIGWVRTEHKIPNLTPRQRISSKFGADFIRDQFQLMIGLNFQL